MNIKATNETKQVINSESEAMGVASLSVLGSRIPNSYLPVEKMTNMETMERKNESNPKSAGE